MVVVLAMLPMPLKAQDGMPLPEEETFNLEDQAVASLWFPDSVGAKVSYAAMIEIPGGYVSGICLLVNDDGIIKGCLVNEFGISALEFTYQVGQEEVELVSIAKLLDKWYIKRVLRKDLAQVLMNLKSGIFTYKDEKYKIDYKFSILKNEAEE